MVRNISVVIVFILALFFSSCVFIGPTIKGNGKVVDEQRTVDKFDKIKVSRAMNVYISQGDEQKVVVKADENILEVISTKVENGVLKITTTERIKSAKSKKVYVHVSELGNIIATAGSNVFSETEIRNDILDLTCSAGSNMRLEIFADKVSASASAGANLFLKGKAKKGDLSASAGANIKAGELLIFDCNAKASSGANVWVEVSDTFSGKASSGANVFFSGDTKTINVSSSSGGNVKKSN